MKKFKNKNAITLIALVITIVVLLILAGVALSLVVGENGITERAVKASKTQNIAGAVEKVELEIGNLASEFYKAKYVNNSLPDGVNTVGDYVLSKLGNGDGYTVTKGTGADEGKITVAISDGTSRKGTIGSDGKISWEDMDFESPEDVEVVEPTEVYGKFYTDGTLILSSTDYTDISRTVAIDCGTNPGLRPDPDNEEEDQIHKIIIHDKIVPEGTFDWFYSCCELESIEGMENLNTSLITNMSCLFYCCCSLNSLDLSSFNTSRVTSMDCMFDTCRNLTSIDLSSFDTSSVTYMDNMFYNCEKLSNIDLSSFDTVEVKNMDFMFYGCSRLSRVDLSGFDMGNVHCLEDMFEGCTSLLEINFSNFSTIDCWIVRGMFKGCIGLTTLDLSNFDTRSITDEDDMEDMFSGCNTQVYVGENWTLTEAETGYSGTFQVAGT